MHRHIISTKQGKHRLPNWARICILTGGILALIAAAISYFRPPTWALGSPQQTEYGIWHERMKGHPFSTVPSADGRWLFVTLSEQDHSLELWEKAWRFVFNDEPVNGVAVLRRDGGKTAFVRFVPTPGTPMGTALSHDGKTLVVAAMQRIVFLDAARLIAGDKDAILGSLSTERKLVDEINDGLSVAATAEKPGSFTVSLTRDDRFLFVADTFARKIAVIDMALASSNGFASTAIVGAVPTGYGPIALSFSPDERYLYATTLRVSETARWPKECAREGTHGGNDPALVYSQGAVVVIDVERAKKDSATAVISYAPAGCSPVRLALGRRGDMAFVAARKDRAILVLDTGKLLTDPTNAKIGRIDIGGIPIGIALDAPGQKLYVAVASVAGREQPVDPNDRHFVNVVDVSKAREGKFQTLGRVATGQSVRELAFTRDQGTLIINNFASKTVELVDLRKIDLKIPAKP